MQEKTNGIDADVLQSQSAKVSIDDVSMVASRFFEKSGVPVTRCNDNYEISTICGTDGNVSLYVVNYANDGGFLIVGPTKNYAPVLAYSYSGNFNVNGIKPLGLLDWQSAMASTVKYVDGLPLDSVKKYQSQWSEYVNCCEKGRMPINTKSIDPNLIDNPDFIKAQAVLRDSMSMWWSMGYETYSLKTTHSFTGNDKIDEEIVNAARGGIYPIFETEYERLSVVLKRPVSKVTEVENFVPATWVQDSGFNASYGMIDGQLPPAGCGPIAAGQIMRYYQYPTSYNWLDMPYDHATSTTADFIHELSIKAKSVVAPWGTSTEIENMVEALKGYGYNAKKGDHDNDSVWENIEKRQPVYMRGKMTSTRQGHAWIASGGKRVVSYDSYELFTFRERYDLAAIYTYTTNDWLFKYFYMNWGWGGSYNGYYMETNDGVVCPIYNSTFYDRSNIYDIKPR